MKGIYITQEGKQEIESKITQLEIERDQAANDDNKDWANICIGQIFALNDIASSPTLLEDKPTESLSTQSNNEIIVKIEGKINFLKEQDQTDFIKGKIAGLQMAKNLIQ